MRRNFRSNPAVTVGDVRRILEAIPEGDSKLQGLISGLIAHGFTPAEAEKIARKYLGVVPPRRNPDEAGSAYVGIDRWKVVKRSDGWHAGLLKARNQADAEAIRAQHLKYQYDEGTVSGDVFTRRVDGKKWKLDRALTQPGEELDVVVWSSGQVALPRTPQISAAQVVGVHGKTRKNPDDIVKPYADAIREALNAGKYQKAVIGLANLTAVLAHKHASLTEQEQHRLILNDVLRALEDVEVHLEMNPPKTVLFHRIPRLNPRRNPNPEG